MRLSEKVDNSPELKDQPSINWYFIRNTLWKLAESDKPELGALATSLDKLMKIELNTDNGVNSYDIEDIILQAIYYNRSI
jgi:hypothetical protein